MELQEYLDIMKKIQNNILAFLSISTKEDEEHRFNDLIHNIDVTKDIQIFKETLHLISTISNYHTRTPNFMNKVEKIILYYKEQIQSISKQEIINIFRKNRRVLLFLFNQQILIPDEFAYQQLVKHDYFNKLFYSFYFYPEFKAYIDPSVHQAIESKLKEYPNLEKFNQRRLIGENELLISKIIREDSLDEFIAYITQYKSNITLQSYFETNPFLINKTPTLIEYATFYGSMKIIDYLLKSGNQLTPSLWAYAVNGNNMTIIQLLESNEIQPTENSYINCMIDAIKCHHIGIARYLQNKYFGDDDNFYSLFTNKYFKYYNYEFMTQSFKEDFNTLYYLIKKDYLYIAKCLLEKNSFDISETVKEKKKLMANDINNKYFYIKNQSLLQLAVNIGNSQMVWSLLKTKRFDINELYQEVIVKEQNINVKKISNLRTKRTIIIKHKNSTMSKPKTPNTSIEYQILLTPLHAAVINCNLEIIKTLLSDPKINVNTKCISDSYNKKSESNIHTEKTILKLALDNRNDKVFQILLNNPKIDINDKTVVITNSAKSNYSTIEKNAILHIAVSKNDENLINQLLLHPKININLKNTTKKYNLKINDDKDQLIKNFDQRNYYDMTIKQSALHLAILNNNLRMVQLLIDKSKINVNDKYYINSCDTNNANNNLSIEKTALHIAIENQYIQIVQFLLSIPKIDVNINEIIKSYDHINCVYDIENEKTTLYRAIEIENLNIIQLLLHGSSINVNEKSVIKTQTKSKMVKKELTSLLYAVDKSNPDIVQMLLENHAEVNAYSVFISKEKNNEKFINLISEQSIPVLNYAIEKGNLNIISVLLVNPSIDVNIKSINRELTLSTNQSESIKHSLNETKKEESALSCAIKFNKPEFLDLLLRHDKINANAKLMTTETGEDSCIQKEETILHQAINKGSLEIIRKLINCPKIDINSICSYNERTKTIKSDDHNQFEFIEKRNDKTAIIFAIENEKLDLLKLLLSDNDIDINLPLMSYERTEKHHDNNEITENKEKRNDFKCDLYFIPYCNSERKYRYYSNSVE